MELAQSRRELDIVQLLSSIPVWCSVDRALMRGSRILSVLHETRLYTWRIGQRAVQRAHSTRTPQCSSHEHTKAKIAFSSLQIA